MRYVLYQKEGVNSNGECNCGNCKIYPELFHALPCEIVPYRSLTTLSEAQYQLSKFPDAVIIEYENQIGQPCSRYKNINTGVTWLFNGYKWEPKQKHNS
jgi:hypothetical protein